MTNSLDVSHHEKGNDISCHFMFYISSHFLSFDISLYDIMSICAISCNFLSIFISLSHLMDLVDDFFMFGLKVKCKPGKNKTERPSVRMAFYIQ